MIDAAKTPEKHLCMVYDDKTISKMLFDRIDLCGENGEFHTLVINGTTFSKRLDMSMIVTSKRGVFAVCDMIEKTVRKQKKKLRYISIRAS